MGGLLTSCKKQMRKKIFLTIILALMLTCCTKDGETIYQINPDEEKPSTAPLVTVIYGPNSLGDRSYCDKIYRGVEASASKHGIRTLHLMPESMEQGQTYLEMMFQQMESAQDSVRRLFIATSPVYDEFIRKNNRRLENNPNADLLYLETSIPLEGKGSTLYIDYYGAMYMAGCFSKYAFTIDLSLLILANPYTQSVVEAGEGFVDGFNDSETKWEWKKPIKIKYLSDEPGGGFQLADTTALRIFQEAADGEDDVCVVPVCGGAMNAFYRILPLLSYYICIDDYISLNGPFNYGNVIKHIDRVLDDYIEKWLNATMPKHQTFGLADGGTEFNFGEDFGFKDSVVDSVRQVAIRKEGERYER
jgi:basic membrane protein A